MIDSLAMIFRWDSGVYSNVFGCIELILSLLSVKNWASSLSCPYEADMRVSVMGPKCIYRIFFIIL